MLEKELYLKKNKLLLKSIQVFLIILFFKANLSTAEESKKLIDEINLHIKELNSFSASFIQTDGLTIEEGKIFKNENRIKLSYLYPNKITLIISDKKGMYYNEELNEVDYFKTEKTPAKIIYDVFGGNFTNYSNINDFESNEIIIKKEITIEKEVKEIIIYFEKSPILLRKIDLVDVGGVVSFGLSNHNFNNNFDKKFFSMINPTIN